METLKLSFQVTENTPALSLLKPQLKVKLLFVMMIVGQGVGGYVSLLNRFETDSEAQS